jgi:hypothetical protein
MQKGCSSISVNEREYYGGEICFRAKGAMEQQRKYLDVTGRRKLNSVEKPTSQWSICKYKK